MAQNDGWLGAMKRGLKRCCPRCGAGGMFTGYLKVAKTCHRCGLDFDSIRSDDVAPYFTILIVGHIVVPLLLCHRAMGFPARLGRDGRRPARDPALHSRPAALHQRRRHGRHLGLQAGAGA